VVNLEAVKIPFANFPDFESCVKAQLSKHSGERGFTVENARRICGAIKTRAEGANMEDDMDKMKKKKSMMYDVVEDCEVVEHPAHSEEIK